MMPLAETGALGATGTLMTAPVLGFAFGWCLERAGLGSARKLAGQFYLTDLTVFKVMFSALLTAMLGAFWLDRFGILDLQLVYLPETFVWPQLAGGALFGAGFLFAGLCPGTSCVAAASGRGDGLAVVGGMLLGVLLFNLSYSQLEGFYNSSALGGVSLSDLAGTSRGLMVGIVAGRTRRLHDRGTPWHGDAPSPGPRGRDGGTGAGGSRRASGALPFAAAAFATPAPRSRLSASTRSGLAPA